MGNKKSTKDALLRLRHAEREFNKAIGDINRMHASLRQAWGEIDNLQIRLEKKIVKADAQIEMLSAVWLRAAVSQVSEPVDPEGFK
tara:strand:- start:515 stop:772 length:258 start_codon:yes stop_codon:yes gene_type:complete